jgi:hypothetical protein
MLALDQSAMLLTDSVKVRQEKRFERLLVELSVEFVRYLDFDKKW